MQWPTIPTCHAKDVPAFRALTPAWQQRTIRGSSDPRNGAPPDGSPDQPEPFRSCFYCGSMHPEDLLRALREGAHLGGADWKYGWPHKFYISEIAHAHEGLLRVTSSTWGGIDPETGKPFDGPRDIEWTPHGKAHSKFYAEHLLDEGFDDEARETLIRAIEVHSGIRFALEDGRLKYAAPHAGYQR